MLGHFGLLSAEKIVLSNLIHRGKIHLIGLVFKIENLYLKSRDIIHNLHKNARFVLIF